MLFVTRFEFQKFRREVQRRIKSEGLNELARRLDVPVSRLRSISSGRDIQASTLFQLCEGFGLSMFIAPSSRTNAELPPEGFSLVDRFDVSLSAGPGAAINNAKSLQPMAFRNEWLYGMNLKASDCVLVGVQGSSMEPIIFPDDLVLLDQRAKDRPIENRKIYAVVDIGGDVRVKRLEFLDETLILRSDNPNFPTEIRDKDQANQIEIIGKVVWTGHTVAS